MSRHEDPTLRYLNNIGVPSGEIRCVTSDTITIVGDFPPSLGIELRVGRRVYVLTDDTAIAELQADTELHEQ